MSKEEWDDSEDTCVEPDELGCPHCGTVPGTGACEHLLGVAEGHDLIWGFDSDLYSETWSQAYGFVDESRFRNGPSLEQFRDCFIERCADPALRLALEGLLQGDPFWWEAQVDTVHWESSGSMLSGGGLCFWSADESFLRERVKELNQILEVLKEIARVEGIDPD